MGLGESGYCTPKDGSGRNPIRVGMLVGEAEAVAAWAVGGTPHHKMWGAVAVVAVAVRCAVGDHNMMCCCVDQPSVIERLC